MESLCSRLLPDPPYGSNFGHKIADFVFLPYISFIIISHRALAREGDYKIHHVCACVRVLVCHTDFSKTTTATDFL